DQHPPPVAEGGSESEQGKGRARPPLWWQGRQRHEPPDPDQQGKLVGAHEDQGRAQSYRQRLPAPVARSVEGPEGPQEQGGARDEVRVHEDRDEGEEARGQVEEAPGGGTEPLVEQPADATAPEDEEQGGEAVAPRQPAEPQPSIDREEEGQ